MKSEVVRDEVGFGKKRPLAGRFWKFRSERTHADTSCVHCKFREIWPTGSRCNHALLTGQKKQKKSANAAALAFARIVPKICQGQLQTIYSECSKFHSNPFTSGGVIAERVNTVQTRHKVFPILGELQLLRRVINVTILHVSYLLWIPALRLLIVVKASALKQQIGLLKLYPQSQCTKSIVILRFHRSLTDTKVTTRDCC